MLNAGMAGCEQLGSGAQLFGNKCPLGHGFKLRVPIELLRGFWCKVLILGRGVQPLWRTEKSRTEEGLTF
jgi:hypothetical protein